MQHMSEDLAGEDQCEVHPSLLSGANHLPPSFSGRRVTIVGCAREGMALARLLVGEGADVTVSDSRPPEALRQEVEELMRAADPPALAPGTPGSAHRFKPLRFALGSNRPEDVLD